MKALSRYKHPLIALVILLVIRFAVPPVNGLTPVGVNVLALIVSVLYLWLTVGTDWVSLLALAGVALTGIMTPAQVYSASFGNATVMIILSCVLLNAVLADTGVVKWLATWFMTRRFVKGRPYLFVALYLLGVTVIGTFMNVTTLCVTFIALTVGICEEIGYKKGTPFYTAMILGLFWLSNVTNGASPISHSLPLLMIGTAEKAGITITYSQYLSIGLPFIVLMYLLTVLVICVFWKPEASLFVKHDVEGAKARREPLSKAGMCENEKSPELYRIQTVQLRAYVSHILDIFDVNKKSERRPDGNEVRISHFWHVRPKMIARVVYITQECLLLCIYEDGRPMCANVFP